MPCAHKKVKPSPAKTADGFVEFVCTIGTLSIGAHSERKQDLAGASAGAGTFEAQGESATQPKTEPDRSSAQAQDELAERPAKEKAGSHWLRTQLTPGSGVVVSSAALLLAKLESERAKLESERAFRESPEGRLQEVIQDIRDRICSWKEHATVVTGRYGCGKSVAVHEALPGLPGTFVHTVKNAEWESNLYKRLSLDGPDMLSELFNRVAAELQKDPEAPSKVPILILNIPRETTEGMPLLSNFAKEMSSDQLGENFWVEDLTEQEAQQLLELEGHGQADTMHWTCEHYTGPDFLEEARRKKEATAHMEVLRFLEHCEFTTNRSIAPAGANILKALLANRKGGDGQGVADLSAGTAVGPKDVTQWMRQKGCHPVIWHTMEEKYRFASERHAEAVAAVLNRR
ncbi:unnamed protein product, partial [Symbiodinium microadriaticum]